MSVIAIAKKYNTFALGHFFNFMKTVSLATKWICRAGSISSYSYDGEPVLLCVVISNLLQDYIF